MGLIPKLSNGVKRWKLRIYNTYRLELTNVGVVREHIPISRRSLVRKLLEKYPYFQHGQMLEFFGCVDAVIQSQSRPFSLLLKDLYDPLNPDKDTVSIRSNFNLKQQETELMDHMRPLLELARYKSIPTENVHRLASYIELPERGLQVRVELNDYSIVEIWHKGEIKGHHAKLHTRGDVGIWKELEGQYYDWMDNMRRAATRGMQRVWARVFKTTPMDEDLYYQRVVVILRKKNKPKLYMKSFKFVPRGSLQVLFPENLKRMGALNAFIMYSSIGASVANLGWKYFTGTAIATEFALPMALVFYRFYYNYDYRKKRYDATIATLLYENNLANNIGVIHEIIDRAESERFTSTILLYAALLHECTVANAMKIPFPAYSIDEMDDKIERWIGEFSRMQKIHDFDEYGAVYNLEKINLITIDETNMVHVKPLDEAIEILRSQITQPGSGVFAKQGNAEWNSIISVKPISAEY